MAIEVKIDPSPPGDLPEKIDPDGGSDGEQLDASLTVFSDKDKTK